MQELILGSVVTLATIRYLAHSTMSWLSIRPYTTARREVSTIVLPGRRGTALVVSAGGTGLGLLLLWEAVVGHLWPVLGRAALALVGAMLFTLSALQGPSVRRPDEIRFDDEFLEISSWSTSVRLPWEAVLYAGWDTHGMLIACRQTLAPGHVLRRPRLSIVPRIRRDRFFAPPASFHRPMLLVRLLTDLAHLDRHGRAGMIEEVVLPVLQVRARTRDGLMKRYAELARMDERREAYVNRLVGRP